MSLEISVIIDDCARIDGSFSFVAFVIFRNKVLGSRFAK